MDNVAVLPSRAGADLIGRAAAFSVLDTFFDRASSDGAAQLLTGGPGVGKTVLLEAACRLAAVRTDPRVVRTAGVEVEVEFGLAGLNQLLLCLQDQLPELPGFHREALGVALGTRSGPDDSPLVVSAAALELLRHVARWGTVLVVIDDAQWLDRASARVLGFVARRLAGSHVGILTAVRSDTDSVLRHLGLPEHEVRPLDEPAAAALLTERHPGLAAPVRRRVLAAAQGNPLALLELPSSMTEGQRRAVDPLPSVLSLSDRLQAVFAARVRELPAGTRRLLLLAALDGTGELEALRAGSSGDGWLDGLAPAERSRLIRWTRRGTGWRCGIRSSARRRWSWPRAGSAGGFTPCSPSSGRTIPNAPSPGTCTGSTRSSGSPPGSPSGTRSPTGHRSTTSPPITADESDGGCPAARGPLRSVGRSTFVTRR